MLHILPLTALHGSPEMTRVDANLYIKLKFILQMCVHDVELNTISFFWKVQIKLKNTPKCMCRLVSSHYEIIITVESPKKENPTELLHRSLQ